MSDSLKHYLKLYNQHSESNTKIDNKITNSWNTFFKLGTS